MDDTFSTRLKKIMEIRGVKQKDLCDLTGIYKSNICRYMSGGYIPKYDNLISISKALKCNPAYLRGESEEYEDFDGLKLANFVKSTTPEIKDFNDLTLEERHCAYIYGECKNLTLKQLEEVEDYIQFIKSKK